RVYGYIGLGRWYAPWWWESDWTSDDPREVTLQLADRLGVVTRFSEMNGELAYRACIFLFPIEFIVAERAYSHTPNLSQPPEAAPRLIKILRSEGRQIGRRGRPRAVPAIWLRDLSAQPRFHFCQVIDQMVRHTTYSLMRRVRSALLAGFRGVHLDRLAFPSRPARHSCKIAIEHVR